MLTSALMTTYELMNLFFLYTGLLLKFFTVACRALKVLVLPKAMVAAKRVAKTEVLPVKRYRQKGPEVEKPEEQAVEDTATEQPQEAVHTEPGPSEPGEATEPEKTPQAKAQAKSKGKPKKNEAQEVAKEAVHTEPGEATQPKAKAKANDQKNETEEEFPLTPEALLKFQDAEEGEVEVFWLKCSTRQQQCCGKKLRR